MRWFAAVSNVSTRINVSTSIWLTFKPTASDTLILSDVDVDVDESVSRAWTSLIKFAPVHVT